MSASKRSFLVYGKTAATGSIQLYSPAELKQREANKIITVGVAIDDFEAARGDKLTRHFACALNWYFVKAGTNAKGQQVRFCWATKRNVAGYFLGWKEVRPKGGGYYRTDWVSRRTKCKLMHEMKERARLHREARAAE